MNDREISAWFLDASSHHIITTSAGQIDMDQALQFADSTILFRRTIVMKLSDHFFGIAVDRFNEYV